MLHWRSATAITQSFLTLLTSESEENHARECVPDYEFENTSEGEQEEPEEDEDGRQGGVGVERGASPSHEEARDSAADFSTHSLCADVIISSRGQAEKEA